MATYIRDEFKKKHEGKWVCNLGTPDSYNRRVDFMSDAFYFTLGEYWIKLYICPFAA